MSELKLCPFCGQELRYFGVDIRDNQKIPVYKHPDEDMTWERCPLSGLVFDKYRWEKRPLEDALTAELNDEIKAHEEIANICQKAGGRDIDGTSVGYVKSLTARVLELEGALKIYADPENWSNDDWGILSVFHGGDKGYGNPTGIAQEVLK